MTAILKRHPALSLFCLAAALGSAPLALVSAGVLPSGFSQLAALSASTAAFVLAALEGGRESLRELAHRGLVWRVGLGWWGLALLYTAPIAVMAILAAEVLGAPPVDWSSLAPAWEVVPTLVVLTVLAGLGEEFGWRGFLLPRLQSRNSALVSSLIVGGLHSLWHVPLFLVAGTAQQQWAQELGLGPAVLGYSVFVVAWAIQHTWVFNNTKGSVLLVAVVHGAGNTWIGGHFDVHGRAGTTGILVLAGLMAVLSVCVVVFAGPRHLSRRAVRDKLQTPPGGDPVANDAGG